MRCWASVPHCASATATPLGARIGSARPMSPCARASATSELVTAPRSVATPSSSSGTLMTVMPSSAARATRSAGALASASAPAAAGRRISAANSLTVSTIIC
ncbi:Uncharacterised protein [Mycobacteroides abscessus subsp. abscessus]|nr:Uncharacterised protein [Mycobacteroides abscessus subsp. abscessus]